jgi:hypothetical protein
MFHSTRFCFILVSTRCDVMHHGILEAAIDAHPVSAGITATSNEAA